MEMTEHGKPCGRLPTHYKSAPFRVSCGCCAKAVNLQPQEPAIPGVQRAGPHSPHGFLLRYISDQQLRSTIQGATNKSEALNRFLKWSFFAWKKLTVAEAGPFSMWATTTPESILLVSDVMVWRAASADVKGVAGTACSPAPTALPGGACPKGGLFRSSRGEQGSKPFGKVQVTHGIATSIQQKNI
jgi:roadblock/LC7 domain-containing protein